MNRKQNYIVFVRMCHCWIYLYSIYIYIIYKKWCLYVCKYINAYSYILLILHEIMSMKPQYITHICHLLLFCYISIHFYSSVLMLIYLYLHKSCKIFLLYVSVRFSLLLKTFSWQCPRVSPAGAFAIYWGWVLTAAAWFQTQPGAFAAYHSPFLPCLLYCLNQ